jgi:hypothetical protein
VELLVALSTEEAAAAATYVLPALSVTPVREAPPPPQDDIHATTIKSPARVAGIVQVADGKPCGPHDVAVTRLTWADKLVENKKSPAIRKANNTRRI